MNKFYFGFLFWSIAIITSAQPFVNAINETEVRRIETALSSDDMEGRKAFSNGSEKAADFISNEFKKTGLETPKATVSYLQTFSLVSPKVTFISASVNSQNI